MQGPPVRPYADAPPRVLAGANGWDTAAVLRYAAVLADLGACSPIRSACEEAATSDDGTLDAPLADWGARIAAECVHRWGQVPPGSAPDAEAYQRASDGLARACQVPA